MSDDYLEQTTELAMKMHAMGLAEIASDGLRPAASAISKSVIEAASRPGCEVRVTVPSISQVVTYSLSIGKILERLDLLDKNISCMKQLELTNGSCIVLRSEEEAEGLVK
jgi:hypothetical protein